MACQEVVERAVPSLLHHPGPLGRPAPAMQCLKLLLAPILKGNVELTSHILLDPAGDADAAWIRKTLQTRRHIHPVAIDVATVDDNVADIDADAKLDPLCRRYLCIAFDHATLNLDSAT